MTPLEMMADEIIDGAGSKADLHQEIYLTDLLKDEKDDKDLFSLPKQTALFFKNNTHVMVKFDVNLPQYLEPNKVIVKKILIFMEDKKSYNTPKFIPI